MPGAILSAALWSLLAVAASSQESGSQSAGPAPLQLTAQQDHKLMMEALKIESLRGGADGRNRDAPNAANYDEAKANPYPDLPDPLVLKDGERVTGRVPEVVPRVTWEVAGTTEERVGDVAAVTKELVGHVDNSACPRIRVDIRLTLTTPADAMGPVPLMREFGFGGFGPRPGGTPSKMASTKAGDAPDPGAR
jgi:hypothetical protein